MKKRYYRVLLIIGLAISIGVCKPGFYTFDHYKSKFLSIGNTEG